MARMRIRDIAREANVSPATVSRYLNGRYEAMGAETRERIAGVIERTGYRPSNAARSLRTDRSRMLGVVIADIRNPYSGAMLEELDAQAARQGYSLMTAASGNNPAREAAAIERLVDAGVDGLVVNTCDEDPAPLARAARRVPVVLLDRDTSPSGLPLVTSNNAQLTAALIDELAEAGCTRLLMFTEADESSSVRRARADAFRSELEARGIPGAVVTLHADAAQAANALRGELGVSGDVHAAGAMQDFASDTHAADTAHERHGFAGNLRERGACKPGLIAVNGLVFLRLVEALDALGLSVPEDAAVATFDDYAWNHVLYGGVTTAVQDTAEIARRVIELLLAKGSPSSSSTEDQAACRPRGKKECAPQNQAGYAIPAESGYAPKSSSDRGAFSSAAGSNARFEAPGNAADGSTKHEMTGSGGSRLKYEVPGGVIRRASTSPVVP